MKVIPVCTALGRGERLPTVCEQETASLGLRELALVTIPFSGILNGGKKGLRSSAPCLLCLVSVFQDYRNLKTSSIVQTLFSLFT